MKRMLFAVAALSIATTAFAADRMVTDETTKAECSACHIAYPPRMLPVASWEALMAGLKTHFGEDDELWVPLDENGQPDLSAAPLAVDDLLDDEEYATLKNAIDLGLEEFGVALSSREVVSLITSVS